jgi:hypothetical protein
VNYTMRDVWGGGGLDGKKLISGNKMPILLLCGL